ncbi:MAG: hypothetical protein CMO12_01595 [Thaumarchaeota archaeon]|jgi:NagD protein|nr:hypothetical protein [Nitrososphaerota archaeon]|tara:strand:+ start:239 stop:1075 length:837 start_codon:yes stop_codon:yes gene_type:complete
MHKNRKRQSVSLDNRNLFLLDLDGVLYVGKQRPHLLGGLQLTERLRNLQKRIIVLTNSSTDTREELAQKLTILGFDITLDEIVSSSYLTGQFLKERYGNADFFLVGERGFREELEAAGHRSKEEGTVDVVVVGTDRQLSYDKLDRGVQLLRGGAKLVASHVARVYMSDGSVKVATGPIAKALEYGSGKKTIAIGKPSAYMFRLALRIGEAIPGESVMVGDQIDTDILGAKRAGIFSILTLTGVEDIHSIKRSKIKPDLIVQNIDDITSYLPTSRKSQI